MNFHHHPAKPLTGAPTPEPVPNWSKLSRADEVEMHSHEQAITSGRIDMLALDGSVPWLQQTDGKGRALFLLSDGVRVYRRPTLSIRHRQPAEKSDEGRPVEAPLRGGGRDVPMPSAPDFPGQR